MFEAVSGGPLSSKAECQTKPSVSACEVGEELVWGEDFITQASGNKIVIVPLKPLKPAQSYIYATTKLIMDSAERPIAPSYTYGLLKLDIDTAPLETADQLMLQTLVNSYEKGMAAAHGVDKESITYSGLFTTQSVADVYETTKLLMLQPGSPYAPKWLQTPTPAGYTVAMAAGLTPADGVAMYWRIWPMSTLRPLKYRFTALVHRQAVTALTAIGRPRATARYLCCWRCRPVL